MSNIKYAKTLKAALKGDAASSAEAASYATRSGRKADLVAIAESLEAAIVARAYYRPGVILDILDSDCVSQSAPGCECDRCAYANDRELNALLKAWRLTQYAHSL